MNRHFALVTLGFALSFATPASPQGPVSPVTMPLPAPLLFEANEGQTDPSVRFLGRAGGLIVYLAPREAVFQIGGGETDAPAMLRMTLAQANRQPRIDGLDRRRAEAHYFVENDPVRWRRHIPTYGRVRYRDVYPGTDVVYYGNERNIEFDFNVAPGADPSVIALRFDGASAIEVDERGDLVIAIDERTLRQHKPVAYQHLAGARREVAARYDIGPDRAVRFVLGPYDRTEPLVIDPVLTYATLLGGSATDAVQAVAVDGNGNAFVAGFTQSTNFPRLGALQSARSGSQDAFVSKFDSAGVLLFSTYLGGTASDSARSVAIDGVGNVVVGGFSTSTNFPLVNAIQSALQGSQDGFVATLNATGNALLQSTYFGGNGSEVVNAVAVDTTGIFIGGRASSTNLPLAGPIQAAFGGVADGFAAKLGPGGTPLVYSTYLGGTGTDEAVAIAVDASGSAHLAGNTLSADFPVAAAFQSDLALRLSARSPDDGTTWEELGLSLTVNAWGFDPRDPAIIYAATTSGLTKSSDGGATFGAIGNLPAGSVRSLAVDPSSPNTIYAIVGDFVYRSTDAGASWTRVLKWLEFGPAGSIAKPAVAVAPSGAVFVAGTNPGSPPPGGVHRSSNQGATWTFSPLLGGFFGGFVSPQGLVIDPLVPSTMYVPALDSFGFGATLAGVYKSTNAGMSWALSGTTGLTTTTRPALAVAVDPSSSSVVYMVSATGEVFKSTNGGAAWTSMGLLTSGLPTGPITAIAVSSATAAAYVSGDFGIFSSPAAGGWRDLAFEGNVTALAFTGPTLYAGTSASNPDGFVAKLAPDGRSLVYSTYLGGFATDRARGVAVDAGGMAYVAGESASSAFPVVGAVVQPVRGGGTDAFVTKLDPAGVPLFSTHLGGSGTDIANGIAVTADGIAHVAGLTTSTNFPMVNAVQTIRRGAQDAFVTKMSSNGAGLIYSTYYGGGTAPAGLLTTPASAGANAIALDATGRSATIGGFTSATAGFPVLNAHQSASGGGQDAIVFAINDAPAGNQAPDVTNPGDQTSAPGASIALDIRAFDPDGDTLRFSATGLPPTLAIDVDTGRITGAIAASATGLYNVRVTASDGSLDTSVDFAWTISAPSDADPPATAAVADPAANAAGWHKTNVMVTLTATDPAGGTGVKEVVYALSGASSGGLTVAGSVASVSVISEGTTTITYFARDNAGNEEAPRLLTIRIDRTSPIVNCTVSPAANAAGWHKSNATISFTASDALSGGVSAPADVVISAEGADQITTRSVTDAAGNAASASCAVSLDKTAPTIAFGAASPAANAAGWHKTDVTIPFTVTDALSGVVDPPASPLSFTSETAGANQEVTATDAAGNTATATSPIVKIDTTAPLVTIGAQSPAANAAGWNNTAVQIPFTVADALSGVDASLTSHASPLAFTAETAGASQTITATDLAGNTDSVTTATVKIDLTAPTLTFGAQSPAANAAGWNNSDVTIPFTPADALSGVNTTNTPSPLVFTTEGAGLTASVVVTDVADNSASFTSAALNIDKTAPVVALGAQSPAANAAGWNKTVVEIPFTVTDALSGVAHADHASPLAFTAETAGATQTVTATDIAGNNAAVTTTTVKIDLTAPTLTFDAQTPAANAAGWNNTDVAVAFTPADNLSGVDTTSTLSPLVFSAEGAGLTASVVVTDVAGNAASFTSAALNIDKTAPVIAIGAQSPPANAGGWNKTAVEIPFTVTDALSGVAQADHASPFAFTAETAGATQTVLATDVAGNNASATTHTVKIDMTDPTLGFAAQNPPANAAGWNNTDVTIAFAPADALSGVDTTSMPSPLVLGAEGAGVTASVVVTDVAGNSASFTSNSVNIDKTAPTLTFAAQSPAANAAGWNKTAVEIPFTVTDALSGVAQADHASPLAFTVETAGATQTVMATDVAGNNASATTHTVKIDLTAPTLTFGGQTPAANVAGWNNTDVSIAFTPADALSGVDTTSTTSPLLFSAEGAGLTASVVVTDVAGNAASFTSAALNIDKTAPVIALGAQSPAANAAGWNKAAVEIPFTVTDALSGVAQADHASPFAFTAETAGATQTVLATDVAGNNSSATTHTVKIDMTDPTLGFAAQNPPANAAGWNNTDVTIAFAPADALSGVDTTSTPSPLVLAAEGAGVTASVVVTDVAGNSASFTSNSVNIDKTAPTLTFAAQSPAANAAGWNNTAVSIPFTPADALSGVAGTDRSSPLLFATETAGDAQTIAVTDAAGNSASFTSATVKIDLTAPTLTFNAQTPPANAAGWNNTDVSVAFTPADNLSGVDTTSTPSPLGFSTEGEGLTSTVVVTDVAGNSASFTSDRVNIDKTAPTITFGARSPSANAAGWNNTDVRAPFSAHDGLSGLADVSAISPLLFTAEGAGLSTNVTATDRAGNAATFASPGVNIDKTPAVVTFGAQSPPANDAGWNNTDVSIPFSVTDVLSGALAPAPLSPLLLVTEGSAVNGIVTVSDVAGNVTHAVSPSVRIDKTAPSLAGLPANCTLWPQNHQLVQVATVTSSDALSGIRPGSFVLNGISSEAENAPGSGNTAPDIVIKDGVVQVRAERNGGGAGRLYTIGATVLDLAGNATSSNGTCFVPHDQGKGDKPASNDNAKPAKPKGGKT